VTPIIKATKGGETKSFFSVKDYEVWRSNHSDSEISKWKIKYYKGLGTSTAAEAKEYFSKLNIHRKDFKYLDSEVLRAHLFFLIISFD